MKFSFKRALSLLLSLLMIVSMVPAFGAAVSAAELSSLTVADLGTSYTAGSNLSWVGNGDSITGTATGYKIMGLFNSTTETTLTLTNNKSGEAELKFSYSLTGGGKVAFDKGTYDGSSYSHKLAAGESLAITLTSPSGSGTNTLTIKGITLLSTSTVDINTTFQAAAGGTYTVNGESITAETVKTGPVGTSYALVAKANSGYKFVGWYDATRGTYIATSATYNAQFDADSTVYPVFVTTATAIFLVGTGNYFYDLDDAVNYATTNGYNQVTLISSGTISDDNYTIPAGMTLLIPYSTDYIPKGENPVSTATYTNPSAYVTLTLSANTTITVNGTVEVGSMFRYCSGGNVYGNAPTGKYGAIYMPAGSNIVLNNTLYAWGYIYGDGAIEANSGAKVYEFMQIADFYGGSQLADMEHMFPFSQYYVQNIEVPLTLKYGATEYLFVKLVISSYELPAVVPFIGSGSGVMFAMESGASSVTKDYDPKTDRLILDINGNAALQSVSMEPDLSDFDTTTRLALQTVLRSMLGSTTINSANYILNLNSNMTVNVNSGTTTISQEMSALPGVKVSVDYGATLKIASGDSSKTTISGGAAGKNVYLFDSEQWGNYVFSNNQLVVAAYSPTVGRYKRTAADLKDVVLDVNGTVVTDGFLYTTVNYDSEFDDAGNLISLTISGGGASIISSEGTGVITMTNGAGAEIAVYNLDGAGATETTIFAASARLQNGDGSYLDTTGAASGTTYNYCATHDKWYTGECDECAAVPAYVEITWVVNGVKLTSEVKYNTVPSYPDGTPAMASTSSVHYTFAGWALTEGGDVLETLPAATAAATYYAVFTSAAHDDDKIEGGKHYCSGCDYVGIMGSCSDTNGDHKCDVGNEEYECTRYSLTLVTGQAATCGEAGYEAYYKCSCGKLYANADATGEITDLETWKTGAGKIAATGNHVDGTDSDHNCDVCGAINIEGHTNDTPVQENGVDATCEAKGSYDEVVYCTECGDEVSCENKATDALGHDWSDATYTWSADGKTCTAEHVCARDASHKETATATVTSEVTTPATCTEKGTTTYTATFDADWAETQTKDVVDIDALGHTDVDTDHYCDNNCGKTDMGTHADADKNHACDYGCSDTIGTHSDSDGDGDHVCDYGCGETLTGCEATGVKRENYVAPTCTEEGSYDSVTYCVECGKENSRTQKTVPATDHDMQETAAKVEATCEEDGKTAVYTCANGCGKTEGGEFIPAINHAWGEPGYTDNGNGTHTASYVCGNDASHIKSESDAHTYTDGVCVCDAAKQVFVKFDFNGGTNSYGSTTEQDYVDYGTTFYLEDPAVKGTPKREGYTCTGFNTAADGSGTAYEFGTTLTFTEDITLYAQWEATTYTVTFDFNGGTNGYGMAKEEETMAHGYEFTFPALVQDGETTVIREGYTCIGFNTKPDGTGTAYTFGDTVTITGEVTFYAQWKAYLGWTKIGNDWYYYNPDHTYATGVARVPYNTELNQGPADRDLGADTFIDYDTGLFVFGDDGKFRSGFTGMINDNGTIRWATNGQIFWHYGLVEVEGVYYYFVGDVGEDGTDKGGNKLGTGDVYMIRPNDLTIDGTDVHKSGIYTYDADGKLCKYDGITKVGDALRYYSDYCYTAESGLIAVEVEDETKYIYVSSSTSQLLVSQDRWIAENAYNIVPGMYHFDENGYMLDPQHTDSAGSHEDDGIYFEDGGYFYYVDGVRTYAGLIQYSGTASDGTVYDNAWIYVRSNGQLATGEYWITKTNDSDIVARIYEFDANGVMQGDVERKNPDAVTGVVDGYYYVEGEIQCGAGPVKWNGNIYYVRSNGKVATGKYWTTAENDILPAGKYTFDEDGKLLHEGW